MTQLFGIVTVLFLSLALSVQPASASGHNVGTRNEKSRCADSAYRLCLYWYSDGTGAYWGLGGSVDGKFHGDADLGNNYFFSGTGTGAGHVVRNYAAAMDCDWSVSYDCASYYSPNYSGNFDYAFAGLGGKLYYTWNDEASVGYL